jgi:hypothetical protein
LRADIDAHTSTSSTMPIRPPAVAVTTSSPP